ncbi:CGAS synthase, partial [Psilopogon haemacephalus]|nr:CGAS synthase [Psilopogon haemacephalus]
LQISEPNEFEVLLEMDEKGLQLSKTDDSGAFYNLCFKKQPSEESGSDCLENGILSASKMLNTLRKIIEIKIKKSIPYVTVQWENCGSPKITLLIKNIEEGSTTEISVDIILTLRVRQKWPSSTEGGLKIEKWLGSKTRESFVGKCLYLVPAGRSNTGKLRNILSTTCWQLSFSRIEELMMNNHGNTKTCCESDGTKCCRADCLELMMYLLEKLKEKYPERLRSFSLHHAKTSFFHTCVRNPNDEVWRRENLGVGFRVVLEDFNTCLRDSKLPHFFIPRYNLLSRDNQNINNFLARKIEEQLRNGFEIF